jgi:DNA-binding transcriptional ArsR family regulator
MTAAAELDLAGVAALVADPGRCRMLLALCHSGALPASVLAREAGVRPSTASGHLARLLEGGLLEVSRQGRTRLYRLASPQVPALLEQLALLARPALAASLREQTRGAALRFARTCHDHLAGRLAVELMARLVALGHLSGDPEAGYALTRDGVAFLRALGIEGCRSDTPVRHCVDTFERRPHLSGRVGAALLVRVRELGWVRHDAATRAVRVTPAGRAGFAERFGLQEGGS